MSEAPGLDRLIVLRAAAGEREALTSVLVALQRPLHRYILRLVVRPEMAEDVLQEVLFRICRKLSWLRDPELLRPWAFRIASRECFRQLHSEKRRGEEMLDGEVMENATTGDASLQWEPRLLNWIDALPPAARSVIALHYLEDMSLDEVGAVLEISTGTVKSRLAYGLELLRRQAVRTAKSCSGGTCND